MSEASMMGKVEHRGGVQLLFAEGEFPVEVSNTEGKPFSFPLYHHPEWEISFIPWGRCHYFIRDRVYELGQGSVAIIGGYTMHNRMDMPDSTVKKNTVIFDPCVLSDYPIAEALLERLADCPQIVLHGKTATKIELLMADMEEEYSSRDDYWQELIAALIIRLLVILDREGLRGSVGAKKENPVIREIIQYIDANYSQIVTLEEVSKHVYMHPNSISRAFSEYTGMGFKKYLIQKRILEAKKLLEHSDMKIASIAFAVGFDNLSAFNRDFRINSGLSPSSYRDFMGKQGD